MMNEYEQAFEQGKESANDKWLDIMEELKTEIEHLTFRPYEGRDTLNRKDVLETIDKYFSAGKRLCGEYDSVTLEDD